MIDIITQLRSYQMASNIRGETRTMCGRAANEIERLRERVAELQAQWGYTESIQTLEIERLRAVLESLTKDPPATLDEPDPDFAVIAKMRAIARAALAPEPAKR